MYSYDWDPLTGGYLLNSTPLSFSKEPRPVYYHTYTRTEENVCEGNTNMNNMPYGQNPQTYNNQ